MSPKLPAFDLDSYLPFRMTVIAGQMSADLARQYKHRFGISMPEWRVLLNVGYSDAQSVRDIEKRVSLEKSKVSRAAARLEAKGLLKKHVDDQDRRLVRMSLTEDGVRLLAEIVPIAQAYQDQLDAALGAQSVALQGALDRLAEKRDDETL